MKFAGALLLLLSSGALAHSQDVMNAANPAPLRGIVPGSRFIIPRYPLGLAAEQYRPDPRPVDPAAVTIEVLSAGRTFPARVITVTNTRVEAVLPADVPLGQAIVRVAVRSGKQVESPVQIVAAAPGLYTHTEQGTQLMATRSDAGGSIGLASPARPGGVVRLRANDFGSPQPQAVEVRVGGVPARVAAVRPGPDGDELIDIEIPPGGKEGCFVPVVARAGGKWSNFGSLPVASGAGPCRLEGFAEGMLERTSGSGLIRIGGIELERSPFWVGGKIPSRKDRLFGRFEQVPVAGLTGLPPNGTCTVSGSRWGLYRAGVPLSTGAVNLRGGKVQWTVTPEKGFIGAQQEDAPWFFRPVMGIEKDSFVRNGPHVLQVDAGRDVDSFSLQFPIQTRSPKWANPFLRSASLDKDLKLRWTGGRAGDSAVIRLKRLTGEVLCVEAAEAASFTIPAWILELLPQSDPAATELSLKILAPAQTARPKGLDSFSFTFSEEALQQISIQ